jgi:hypothetical protein
LKESQIINLIPNLKFKVNIFNIFNEQTTLKIKKITLNPMNEALMDDYPHKISQLCHFYVALETNNHVQ